MKSTVVFPRLSIDITREEIPTMMMSPEKVPDETWRFVDAFDHGHFWKGKELPTLEWVVTGVAWVGDEYDGHEYETGEYRCRQCREVVEPKYKHSYGPPSIPGPAQITITINDEQFVLWEEDYAASLDLWAKLLRENYP